MLCVWGVAFLFLALSLASFDVNHISNKLPAKPTHGPTLLAGNTSLTYSSQWGSYGGPVLPNGVATDSAGNVYVADAKNYGIVKLARNGSYIMSWGSFGSGHGEFRNPEGVALDAFGDVFVTDSVNNNVQKFTNTGAFVTS